MRGLDAIIKLHRFQLDEKRRTLLELQDMRDGITASLTELAAELVREQAVATASTEARYAYGGYARSVIARRDRLSSSLEEVERQIENAQEVVAEAFEELKKYEITKAGRDRAAIAEANRREQLFLDELGITQHRRRAG